MVMAAETDIRISNDLLAKYLNVYLGDIGAEQWLAHLQRLYSQLVKKISDPEDAAQVWRKTVACAILLPEYDRSALTSPPENLLFWVGSYRQLEERDWYTMFKQRVAEDQKIEKVRKHLQSLGMVYPLEYSPITRQAVNWLMERGQFMGHVTKDNRATVKHRFEKLVYAYGGEVVCGVFEKTTGIEKKILSWRTSYFFERLIFTIYSPEQLVKIKNSELKKTHPKLIRQIAKKEQ